MKIFGMILVGVGISVCIIAVIELLDRLKEGKE